MARAEELLGLASDGQAVAWNGGAWHPTREETPQGTLIAVPSETEHGLGFRFKVETGHGSQLDFPISVGGALDAELLAIWLDLAELWLARQREKRQKRGRPGRNVPDRSPIPQPTFIEVRYAGAALADGPSGQHWVAVDEDAMEHRRPGSPFTTRVEASGDLDWLDRPASLPALRAELRRTGTPALLALFVTVGLAVQRGRVTLDLDRLGEMVGQRPRSSRQRRTMRRELWRLLKILDRLEVVGRRPGTWRDRNRSVVDLVSRDPLIRIVGRRDPDQMALDGSEPPLEVTVVPGQWIDNAAAVHDALTRLGDVLPLAAIPAGRPSGAWAQAAGLSLRQIWRERATRGAWERVTRRQIFALYPPQPDPEETLRSHEPGRARTWWCQAMALLQKAGVIGSYHEVERLPESRQGWADAWLDQPLEIALPLEETRVLTEIADTHAKRRKRRTRRDREKAR